MKRFTFLAVFFILGALAFSAGLRERIYKDEVGERLRKEVTVDGKTLSKLVEVYSVIEYDSNGNLIHSKDSDGDEKWYEYDSNGNQIHYKDNDGEEYWHEYTYWKNGKVKTKTEYHAL